jgi:hypothetical protein
MNYLKMDASRLTCGMVIVQRAREVSNEKHERSGVDAVRQFAGNSAIGHERGMEKVYGRFENAGGVFTPP